eukprot:CAMPEP_0174382096 /NCGR_PEP_ID=MMETSP0811_2-20130205/124409_1 /TAXON_ID=73025 ORGANISM="Eutreptiella gymnastica-like, Strain CCMP1594" /NCGR_SAMPLE_ID=MMETSP0811_2 /ASSEMBLY_ACC=CAM_ASM_000667 /LENGTH=32 /DNA_ID= /DNA_START= /DNA_END= /DNA_ORIENTATION=
MSALHAVAVRCHQRQMAAVARKDAPGHPMDEA